MESYFPVEVVWNILKRLPAEDVHPLKMVCKGWCSLISDPSFIQDHLHYHRLQPPPKLFIRRKKSPTDMHKGLSITYDEKQDISSIKDELLIKIPIITEREVWLRASCDGLMLLLGDSGTLYVCNPITRRCSILLPTPSMYHNGDPYPHGPKRIPFNKLIDWIFFFDSTVQNYKIFGVSNPFMACVMFTFGDFMKKNEWSPRIPLELNQLPMSSIIYSGNQLHWIGSHISIDEELVCSFDVVTKEIENRSCPLGSDNDGCYILLVEVNGRLCFTMVFSTHLDLWFLEGIAPKDHWEKQFTIPVFSHINLVEDARLCLVSMKHAASNHIPGLLRLFIHRKDKLFYFDFNSLDLKQIAVVDHCHKICYLHNFHFGSLVSWNPYDHTASSGMQGTSHCQNPLRNCNTKREITDSSNCQEVAAKFPRLN